MAPAVRCVSTKIGARAIVTPMPLSEKQRTHCAVKWILEASNAKPGETLEERLATQIITIIGEQEELLSPELKSEEYTQRLQSSALRKKGNVRSSRRS
ncbi:hypothetical protein OBBRIDRAFT_834328 [Obba rivulosa]|uniref:Small ribosomal subunit protein uS7 domain-containing protein n=1 Tax=Obba rivulosa TaxID=1052685 RepID=A0A8E2AY33_9APHY|nr:hypothetical protein OBBRIDRAFT_834328 [Obba rivulosa]